MDEEKALQGFESFLGALSSGTMRIDRDKAMRTSIGEIEIDTCIPGDTGKWETGIRKDGTCWIIVEQYEDINVATKGHNEWVKKINENPNCELNDIDLWGLNTQTKGA